MLEIFYISIIFVLGIIISWKIGDYFEVKDKRTTKQKQENETNNT